MSSARFLLYSHDAKTLALQSYPSLRQVNKEEGGGAEGHTYDQPIEGFFLNIHSK